MSKCLPILILSLLVSATLFGQWTELNATEQQGLSVEKISKYHPVRLNSQELLSILERAPLEFTNETGLQLAIPLPDGTVASFAIYASPILEEGLARKFPSFKSFTAQNINQPAMVGRLDWTSKGFHGFFLSPQGSIYLDPLAADVYVAYYKKDRIPPTDRKHFCGMSFNEEEFLDENLATSRGSSSVGENLRTLRIAVATTGEYTNYHGSTTDALAAVVTTINRVNLVYEIDLSLRFLLVENNDQIIFTDASTDPYNNNSAGNMLNTNTAVLNANIGNGNYDIGHVFATAGAGLAGLGVVCSGDKGEGVTGIDPPEGTTFDVDYVSHEIGHQLSAFHTFNNCNGPGGTPTGYEPGSGSTIMAYAGLCGASNVQFSSGDYFHGISLNQMNNYLDTQGTCFDEIPTNNLPPSVATRTGNFFIPMLTPFELTAQATDPDGDQLTYCWEQFNAGPLSTLGEPTGNAPAFRSFPPSEDSTRVFPKIANVINNITSPLEVLPSYTRGFRFNVVVRDNNPGGGGSASTDLSFQATQAAGPFKVTAPNTPGIQWEGNQQVEITWDVANTDQAPVNCSHVDIMLYTGTEFTFHSILALNTPNDGSEFITVPDETLVFARIKIKAHDNIFFNVSNNHFLILEDPAATTEIGDSRQLAVFPNPANEEIYLNLQNGTGIDEIFLFNALGQQLHHQRLTSNLGLQSINTQAFSDGVYLLRVQAGNKFYTKKVVLKH